METSSPYSPPQVELLGDQEAYGQIKIFSASGRIGRLRYIAYNLVVGFVGYLIMGLLLWMVGAAFDEEQAALFVSGIFVLVSLVMFFISVLLTIQRSHDFNSSGWMSLLLLLPLVPIIFWFIPGTEGGNSYGPPPPPNKGVAIILVVALFLVVILGILAAIAIPAYQEYMARAAAAGM